MTTGCRVALVRFQGGLLAGHEPSVTLDAFGLALPGILQPEDGTPQRTIGEAVGLSAPLS